MDLDLRAIRERAEKASAYTTPSDVVRVLEEDVPALLARVSELERERDEARAETDALRIQVRAVTLSALTVEGQCAEEHLWSGQEACGALFDAGRMAEEDHAEKVRLHQEAARAWAEVDRLRSLVTAAHSALPPKWPSVRGECVGCGAPLFCTNDHAVPKCWAETVANSLDEALHPDRSEP